jgi:NAD(P)-dependent dehydrogenase (short-subunit alcohol dehydrogenase family)
MTSPRLVILTGASRGLGAAMAEQLLEPETTLLCMSRGSHPTLSVEAARRGATLIEWPQDLADAAAVVPALSSWLGGIDAKRLAHAVLINNAAIIPTPGATDDAELPELLSALRVGLEAAVLLTAVFLRATRTWPADRRVLHISSGLGRRAMAGSAVYCATKAGMDHHARAVALDEEHRAATGRGAAARIVSLAPGVIDTDMQRQLRGADPATFAHHETFAQLHERGQLTSPDDAARAVLAYLWRKDFCSSPVADVRDR